MSFSFPPDVDYSDHSRTSSLYSPDYTYSDGALSCASGMFPVHQALSYVVFVSGILCFITRALPPKWKSWHALLGRIYILAMLWCTATSLLINNTGLPEGVIVSFTVCLIALSFGWLAILIHKQNMGKAVEKAVEAGATFAEARTQLVNGLSFRQRILSWKALHGVLFFVSWFNIAGRVFATPWRSGLTCHTYPVYKPINTNEFAGLGNNLTLVAVTDPDGASAPWARVGGNVQWGLIVTLGAGFAAFVALLIAAYVGARRDFAAEKQAALDVPKSSESQDDSQVTL